MGPKVKPRQKERQKDKVTRKTNAEQGEETIELDSSKPARSPRPSSDRLTKAPRLATDAEGDIPMAEESGPTPGLVNLFGLHVGARSQTSLPVQPAIDHAPRSAMPLVAGSGDTSGQLQHQKSQSGPSAPAHSPHTAGLAQRRNREDIVTLPQPLPISTQSPAGRSHQQDPVLVRRSRSITHIDMSEDDLRSWVAAAEALLPTLASVDQELSNSSLDDKVSGRRH